MKKVIIPHKVGNAIEWIKKNIGNEFLFQIEIMVVHYKKSPLYKKKTQDAINTIINYIRKNHENRANYFNAIVNGYILEPSKEEQLLKVYQNAQSLVKQNVDIQVNQGIMRGIEDTVRIFKLDIPQIKR